MLVEQAGTRHSTLMKNPTEGIFAANIAIPRGGEIAFIQGVLVWFAYVRRRT